VLRQELFLKLPNYGATFLFSFFHHPSNIFHQTSDVTHPVPFTENPLWGMASDESVATRIEIMYAYSPK
jgi:hypothetical protein